MDINVYSVNELTDEKLNDLIRTKSSFVLTDVTHMKHTVKKVEELIEMKDMKCRVYTKGRVATVAAAAIPVSPAVIGGWLSAAAIGVHNLATYDPDYELAKNPIKSELEVNYKR